MNSFRFLERGIEAEIARQRGLLESGEEVVQETLHFHPEDGSLTPLRSKEYAHDYRYFPEPDLVPVVPTEEMLKEARESLPELPAHAARALPDRDRALGGGGDHPRLPRRSSASTSSGRVAAARRRTRRSRSPTGSPASWWPRCARPGAEDDPLASKATPEAVAALAGLVRPRRSPTAPASRCWRSWSREGGDPAEIVEREGLAQISDSSELEGIVDRAIEAEPEAAEQVRQGNEKAIGRIVGAVMKETKGRADGGAVTKLIKERSRDKLGAAVSAAVLPSTQMAGAPYMIIALLFGLATGFVGRGKGSSFFIWFLIGTVLPLLRPDRGDPLPLRARGARAALPDLQKILKLHVQVCPRCGTDLYLPDPSEVRPGPAYRSQCRRLPTASRGNCTREVDG